MSTPGGLKMTPRNVSCARVHINSQGYSSKGVYYVAGENLYCLMASQGSVFKRIPNSAALWEELHASRFPCNNTAIVYMRAPSAKIARVNLARLVTLENET